MAATKTEKYREEVLTVNMRPQAHPGATAFLRPLAAGIPLAMQVIGHVYDVINYLGDFGYREGLEVPVRCWSGN